MAAGAVAVAAAGQLPVVVAVGRVAALAETGIVVEPGRVDLAEVQGTAERLGDPAGPAGVDGVAVAIKTLRLVRILGTCRWMSQQMSKSSPAYRPSSLRKTHSASRPAHETQVLAVIGSGSSEYGLRMPAPLFACKPARCPFGHSLARGKPQKISWMPCICGPARERAEHGQGMGHVTLWCGMCSDQDHRDTVFYEPPHDLGHRALSGWMTRPDA